MVKDQPSVIFPTTIWIFPLNRLNAFTYGAAGGLGFSASASGKEPEVTKSIYCRFESTRCQYVRLI